MPSSDDPAPEPNSRKLDPERLRNALWIFAYLGRYRWMFISALVAVLVTSGLSFAFPVLMGRLVGESMTEAAVLSRANQIAVSLAVILTIQALITFARMQLLGRAGDRALADMRKDTYRRLVHLPMSFYVERRVGEISSRLAADLTLIRDTLVSTAPQFLRQCVMLLAGLTFLFVISPKLSLFMLASLPAVVLFIAFFGFRIRGHSRAAQDRLADSQVILDETLHGITDVKAFANEDHEVRRYEEGMQSYLTSAEKLVHGRAFMVAFVIFALFGVITLIVWFGARMLVSGEISQAAFTQFCLITAFVAGAFASLPEIVSQLQKAVGATDRLKEILDEPPEDKEASDKPSPEAPSAGALHFENVSFSYPSRPDVPVLTQVSFQVNAGERIALVGPSGAGKSTTVSLTLRFFEPSGGRILLDGRELPEYPLQWLRAQMAIVPQDVLLFGGTIRENIAYGNPEASDPEIHQAAERAFAQEFIQKFPDGFETVVGERGIKLSGGQRQRIAIARAILANPSILLLDEATSSLDAESERLVQAALDELMSDRTSIIIAHRLSTVRNADRILVLDSGQIVQEGTHEDLIRESEGIYSMLAKLQLS